MNRPSVPDAPPMNEARSDAPSSRARRLALGLILLGLWRACPDAITLGRFLRDHLSQVLAAPSRIDWSRYPGVLWGLAPLLLGAALAIGKSPRLAKAAAVLGLGMGLERALSLISDGVFDSDWLKRKGGVSAAPMARLLPAGPELASAVGLAAACLALGAAALRINANWRRSVRGDAPRPPRLDRRPSGRLITFGSWMVAMALFVSLGWETYLNVLDRAPWLRGMILKNDRRPTRRVVRRLTPEEKRFREASGIYNEGVRQQAAGNFAEARETYAKAFKKYESLHEDVPGEPGYSREYALAANNLAWFLVTCPDASVRDPKTAVSLARRATALDPEDGNALNTLGAAHLRAGNLDEAASAFRRSMALRDGGDSFDWYFLAEIDAAQGRPREALSWYEQAVAWHARRRPDDPELIRFRIEAAAVLGLPRPEEVPNPSAIEPPPLSRTLPGALRKGGRPRN